MIDLVSESDAFQLAGWALETGLWNGRPISWESASIFHEQLQSRLMDMIESDVSSQALDQFKASLAWIGTPASNRVFFSRELEVLTFSGKDQIIPVGFWKSTKKFWKKHKTEIIVGAVIIAVAVVISVAAISYVGAGAAALEAAVKDKKDSKSVKASLDTKAIDHQQVSVASEHEPSSNQVVFSDKGVAIGSDFASYEEILTGDLPESIALPNSPAKPSWIAGICETIGKGMCNPELLTSEDSFPMPEFSRMIISDGGGKAGPRIIGINGINNSYDEALVNMDYTKSFAPNVDHEWVYNNSHGPIIDIGEVFALNYNGISPNTANLLHESVERFDQDNRDFPHEKCLIKCHSQGAAHVRNALEQMPKHLRQRTIVIAIAPAVVVPRALCYRSYNYACESDIVPRGEVCAAVMKDFFSGLAPEMDQIPGMPEAWSRTKQVLENREELIWLKPDPNCKENAHSYKHPVYVKPVRGVTDEYVRRNGEYK